MLRCSWCMKKLSEDKECFGLSVKFKDNVDFSEEGKITQIFLTSRNTSVPLIVVAKGSEASKQGHDGIFALCSEKCGEKMQNTLRNELDLFRQDSQIVRL